MPYHRDIFELAEPPFKITPDPRFLWYSPQHLEAKEKIVYYLTEGIGPIYLTAQVGTGKSSIARRVLQELSEDERRNPVYLFAPQLKTANAFLRFVMDEFHVPTDHHYAKSLQNFQNWLGVQHKKGQSPILLIDEAQNMTREMLTLIQHFFNFSTNDQFLIHMALFAQPELDKKLRKLPSLVSRLSPARLRPFDRKQTEEMMQFRWTVAGGKKLPFSGDALDAIHEKSNGVPRSIVKLAHLALLEAQIKGKKEVTKDEVISAWQNIKPTEGE